MYNKRMAVFVCAADESADTDHFFYGGFAAPLGIWEGCFADAWNERVLNGPPQIPYLHMTDIREWGWQDKHGLSRSQASARIEAAADVIRSTGGLVPVIYEVDRRAFARILRQPFSPSQGQRVMLEADYLCFAWFAFTQLQWLHDEYGEEVEKVDLWVEENGPITRHMHGFHRSLLSALTYVNRPHLASLVGEFLPVSKTRIPVQTADMLTWHSRNRRRGRLDRDGHRRGWKMTESGVPGRKGRFGHRGTMTEENMRDLAERFAKYPAALNRAPDAED
jgi:hypothetical protein